MVADSGCRADRLVRAVLLRPAPHDADPGRAGGQPGRWTGRLGRPRPLAQGTGDGRDRGDGRSRGDPHRHLRSEEHTSELQSLMRISYAVFCLKKKKKKPNKQDTKTTKYMMHTQRLHKHRETECNTVTQKHT